MNAERNMRVEARYDDLMRGGKHGHYETLFRIVREEVEREWRSMDTAPKTGESILTFDPYNGRRVVTRWSHVRNNWLFESRHTDRFKPTHWQPLPEPPTQSHHR